MFPDILIQKHFLGQEIVWYCGLSIKFNVECRFYNIKWLSTDNTVKIAPMIEDSGTWFCENSTKIAQNCANDRERDENCEKEKKHENVCDDNQR